MSVMVRDEEVRLWETESNEIEAQTQGSLRRGWDLFQTQENTNLYGDQRGFGL